MWGFTPRPTRELCPLDPERGDEITGLLTQRLCRLKRRKHGGFGDLLRYLPDGRASVYDPLCVHHTISYMKTCPHVGRACPHVERACPHVERACPHVERACPHVERACPHVERACPHVERACPRKNHTIPERYVINRIGVTQLKRETVKNQPVVGAVREPPAPEHGPFSYRTA